MIVDYKELEDSHIPCIFCKIGKMEIVKKDTVNNIRKTCGNPRYHKKIRFQKKFLKSWQKKNALTILSMMACAAIMPPILECSNCKKRETLNQYVCKNLISVRPLPPELIKNNP